MNNAHSYTINNLSKEDFPAALLEIPQVPEKLFIVGELPDPTQFYYLAVVGSRKYTSYGKEATERIIAGLAGYPICIVSGLAMGIDGLAHRAALDAGLPTVAVPGSGLDSSVINPRVHAGLAREIIESGGALLSEYEPLIKAAPWTFPQRNRIMAGLCQGVLIIEAEEQSGTLITARLALDYNRNVFVIPGSIFSATAKGTNKLIRQGATPITSADELLEEIGLKALPQFNTEQSPLDLTLYTPDEQTILVTLETPTSREELFTKLSGSLPIATINSTLTILEIKGIIREKMGKLERM